MSSGRLLFVPALALAAYAASAGEKLAVKVTVRVMPCSISGNTSWDNSIPQSCKWETKPRVMVIGSGSGLPTGKVREWGLSGLRGSSMSTLRWLMMYGLSAPGRKRRASTHQ